MVAITGSPGVGKTSVAEALARRGYGRLDLLEIAQRIGVVERGADGVEVDVEALAAEMPAIPGSAVTVVESTWAHLLPVDAVVVLRCSPEELRTRLAAKGWREERIRDALEAEAVDVIAGEVLESGVRAWEVDTTSRSAKEVAEEVDGILRGEMNGSPPGTADWSEEVLSWY